MLINRPRRWYDRFQSRQRSHAQQALEPCAGRVGTSAEQTCRWRWGEGGWLRTQRNRLSFQLPASGVEIDAAGLVVWANTQRQGIEL